MNAAPKRRASDLSGGERRAIAETAGRRRLEAAVTHAVNEPCRIVLHDGGAAAFVARLYERIRDEVLSGRVPVGVYGIGVMVGSHHVPLKVTVQADLFDALSVVIDHAALDRLEGQP